MMLARVLNDSFVYVTACACYSSEINALEYDNYIAWNPHQQYLIDNS